jgi:DNA-binding NarL/FixJ family response regulator
MKYRDYDLDQEQLIRPYQNGIKLYKPTGRELDGIYLSKRETDCLYQLIKGNTTKMTAKILELSPRTVESYL